MCEATAAAGLQLCQPCLCFSIAVGCSPVRSSERQPPLFAVVPAVDGLRCCAVLLQVCVQTSMREANDRGYECLLVTDATGRLSR